MKIGKRILLFLLTNIAIMLTIGIITSVFGLNNWLSQKGIDYTALLVFSLIWGMGGAFISLLLSKVMAKWMMGVQIIDSNTHEPELKNLVLTVNQLALKAGLKKMPEVGIYNSPELNAFATGPSSNNSLVAVSTGLLQRMNKNQVEGVLGHEIAHIANGDMVTMTLIQGVINAFVLFLSRAIAFGMGGKDDDRSYLVKHITMIVLQIIFSILASIVVGFFSRQREYRADAGGAKIAGRDKMISALKALSGSEDMIDNQQESYASLKISGKPSSLMALFSTHPPIEERIKRLEFGQLK